MKYVLVFYHCYDKLPQAKWLKTKEINNFRVL